MAAEMGFHEVYTTGKVTDGKSRLEARRATLSNTRRSEGDMPGLEMRVEESLGKVGELVGIFGGEIGA